MTYDAFHQDGKGSASERRLRPVAASCSIARGSAALVGPVRDIRASGISVPAGVLSSRSSGRSDRGHDSCHLETAAQHARAVAEARKKQRHDDGSDRDRRLERISRRSEEAWLSRVPRADPFKFRFPIRLIVFSSRNSRRPTTSWCPVASVRSVGG